MAPLAPFEVIGEIVDEFRERRATGARPSQLVRFLYGMNIDPTLARWYFDKAFLGRFMNFLYLPRDAAGAPDDDEADTRLERRFAEAGDAWRSAPPYPDLLCRHDREAFRAVARNRSCHVLVQAASSYARLYRGRPGFVAWPGGPHAVSRRAPPHAGLMAVDPGDPVLVALLAAAKPSCSYDEHVTRLSAGGFAVSGPEEGYVISDAKGRRFYPGYGLHGVYAEDTRANLWRAPEGEAIRRELNLRMGLPLVAHGPHGVWRFRNAPAAGPFRGPQPPVLWFDPKGSVDVREDVEALRKAYRHYVIPWPYSEPPPSAEEGTK